MDDLNNLDLSKFSDRDLDALEAGNFDALSPQGKELILGQRDFSAKRMFKNIPSDAKEYGSEIAGAVMHPIDTSQALYKEIVDNKGANIISQLKNSYGSVDNALVSLEQRPVHTLADLSSVLFPASKALNFAATGRLSKAATLANPSINRGLRAASSTLNNVASITDPLALGVRAAKTAAKLGASVLPEDTAARIFRSATKVADPEVADMMMKRGINPLEADDLSAARGAKSIIGRTIGDIVNDNDKPIKASRIFNNMDYDFNNLNDPSISAGTEGMGFRTWARRFADHIGYDPGNTNLPLRKILGIKKHPLSPYIDTLSSEERLFPVDPNVFSGTDPDIGLKALWKLRQDADNKHFTKSGDLKSFQSGPASGRMAAERNVSGNIRKILRNELANTGYSDLAKNYGDMADIVREGEDAAIKYAKTDDPFKFHSLLPVTGGYAAGYALGGHKLGTLGAIAALGAGALLNPKRKANFGIFVDRYANMPWNRVLSAEQTMMSPLADILSKIEEERNYKFRSKK